jgi:CDP-diglyceride synthetase
MTRKKETMTIFPNTIRQMSTSLVSLWAITAIHHAYEAARYPSLHYPSALWAVGGFTVLLLLTLALLGRYERTASRLVYQFFTTIVLLVWVGLIGLYLSANYYVLRNLLFLTHAVPLSTLRDLWPVEQVPPNDLFHEGTGSLIFFFAIWVAVAWLQLERERRRPVASPQGVQKADALSSHPTGEQE